MNAGFTNGKLLLSSRFSLNVKFLLFKANFDECLLECMMKHWMKSEQLALDSSEWLALDILKCAHWLDYLCCYRIPLWGKIKFFAVCWLVLPQFNGAAFVYDYFVKKKLFKQGSSEVMVSQRLERMMSPNAQSSVKQFIDDHGQDAFEKVIAAVHC